MDTHECHAYAVQLYGVYEYTAIYLILTPPSLKLCHWNISLHTYEGLNKTTLAMLF